MVKVLAKGKSNNELAKELKTIDINSSPIAELCLQKERLVVPIFLLIFLVLSLSFTSIYRSFLLRWDITDLRNKSVPPKIWGFIHQNSSSSLKKLMRFQIVFLPEGTGLCMFAVLRLVML